MYLISMIHEALAAGAALSFRGVQTVAGGLSMTVAATDKIIPSIHNRNSGAITKLFLTHKIVSLT